MAVSIAVASSMTLLSGCAEHQPHTGTVHPVDTLELDLKGLGQTLWGARCTERGLSTVAYVIDEFGVCRQFDLSNGAVNDEVDLGAFLESVGLDRSTVINGVVWLSVDECLLTLLDPDHSFVICNTKTGQAVITEVHESVQNEKGLLPGCIPSICEPRLLSGGSVIVPMQPMMSDLFTNEASRRSRYSLPPVTRFHLDSMRRITGSNGRGTFPELYRDSLIRVQYYSYDVEGDNLYLAFGMDPRIYVFCLSSGHVQDTLSLPTPVAFDNVPYDAVNETSHSFREYFYQVSRSHALKVLPNGDIIRTFIVGKPLPKDSIIDRNFDHMDWVMAVYPTKSSPRYYEVPGDEYLNSFFVVVGTNIYLQRATSTFDAIHLVRIEVSDE